MVDADCSLLYFLSENLKFDLNALMKRSLKNIFKILLIFNLKGRESGIIQKFNLSTGSIMDVYLTENNGIVPTKISVNSTST